MAPPLMELPSRGTLVPGPNLTSGREVRPNPTMAPKALATLLLLAFPALAQDAAEQVRTEIQRLRGSLQAQPITDSRFAESGTRTAGLLKAADESVKAGALFLSLERLVQLSDFVKGVRTTVEATATVKGSLPAFEAEWRKASAAVADRERRSQPVDWKRMPAAIAAIAEVARARTGPLLEGGRGFAISTKPEDGLFYLGEALAQAEFADFCAGLHFTRAGTAFPLRSLLPELLALQQKANAAFQPPRSVDLHPRFIALNSTIKLARELDASRAYAGALYQYMEAVRHYGMLFMPALDATQQAEVKQALAAAQHKAEGSKNDDSILQILLQRAASQVAHADGSAPSEDEWKTAQVTLQQVLPAYSAARKAPPSVRRTAGKTVDLTLVRWPYT
jgi:hypothetical protein